MVAFLIGITVQSNVDARQYGAETLQLPEITQHACWIV